MKQLLAKLKPSDIIGIRSANCVGRAIRWCSTGSLLELSPDAPNHLAQVIDSTPPGGPLWAESSVTTRVPCTACGDPLKGVHYRWAGERLEEEMRRGSTIYRYRFVEPFTDAEQIALYDAWAAKHGLPYDYWGAHDAGLRGAGRLLALGLHKWIPNRSTNGRWFCSEIVLDCLCTAGRWHGNPSRWNPATATADLLERGVVKQEVLWRPKPMPPRRTPEELDAFVEHVRRHP